ncbi:YcaO-like family protein [Rhodospirillum sp. A1_3_36]|uniref:YcaO-like family protein n=1 Tax=Rhodospirillum sp. A1_3_36 TaxID=3391666 RepID=UPI0039A5BE99
MANKTGNTGPDDSPVSHPAAVIASSDASDQGEKIYRKGTHRSRAPFETLALVTPHLAAMGITRVANVTGLDRVGLPVVAVYRPNARSVVVAQGKGLDLAAAKISGLMEAIESDHAERPDLPLHLASEADLRQQGRAVADTTRLPRLSVSRYDPFRPILWCEAEDLMADGAALAVPFEMVHTNFTRPLPTGSGNFQMSSNGLASGNHPFEAICHGLCEVIERDALALWSLRGGSHNPQGRLDLDSVDDPTARDLIARLHNAGLTVGVWDITTDVGVAAFLCLTADRETGAFGPAYISQGSGCHPAREVALSRALTEAAQTRLTYIAGTRDDANREFFESARNSERVAALRTRLDAIEASPRRSYGAVAHYEARLFEDDLNWILKGLTSAGLSQVAVVRFPSRIDGIFVVRVIVPGLEGLCEAPGYVRGERALAAVHPNREHMAS